MQEPAALLLIILLTIATFPPYLLVFRALAPVFDQQVQAILTHSPGRSLGIGVINLLFWGTVIAVFGALADGAGQIFGLPALILIVFLVAGLSIGLGSVSQIVGETWLAEHSRARQAYWGAMAVTLGSLMPFIGWFLLFPLAATAGLGAVFMNLLARFQPPQTPVDGEA